MSTAPARILEPDELTPVAVPTPTPAPPAGSTASGRHRGFPLQWAVGLAVAGYVVAVAGFAVAGRHAFIFKTTVVPILLLVVLVGNRFRTFVQDWMIFLSAVVLFDAVRGFAFAAMLATHRTAFVWYPVRLETLLFGTPALGIPIQRLVANSGIETWLNPLCIVLHASHFAFFLLFGLALWAANRREFGRWAIVMMWTMATGLLVYGLVPTAPPWLAGSAGRIPKLVHIAGMAYNSAVPALRTILDTNPVAAMPSLHGAFPAVCALAATRTWGARGRLLWLYVAAMGFALVYLGEHYAVDVVAGVVLAVLADLLVGRWSSQARWAEALGWCRWPAMRHFTVAMGVVLLAVLLSTWTSAMALGPR